jgi:hypothetical protein
MVCQRIIRSSQSEQSPIKNIFVNMLVQRFTSVDLPPARQSRFDDKPLPPPNRTMGKKWQLLRPWAYQAPLAAQDIEELR